MDFTPHPYQIRTHIHTHTHILAASFVVFWFPCCENCVCILSIHATNKKRKHVDKQRNKERKQANKQTSTQAKERKHANKQASRENACEEANKQASKEKECPLGTNVGLDIVSIDPLDWIMDDIHAIKHGSKKGTRDPVYKDKHEPAWDM